VAVVNVGTLGGAKKTPGLMGPTLLRSVDALVKFPVTEKIAHSLDISNSKIGFEKNSDEKTRIFVGRNRRLPVERASEDAQIHVIMRKSTCFSPFLRTERLHLP